MCAFSGVPGAPVRLGQPESMAEIQHSFRNNYVLLLRPPAHIEVQVSERYTCCCRAPVVPRRKERVFNCWPMKRSG